MKIWAITKDGKYLKIGDNNDGADWYGYDATTANFVKTLKKGDVVSIKFKKLPSGKFMLTYVTKDESAPDIEKEPGNGGAESRGTSVNESIKRQAIGHMVARTLIALQGTVDINNVGDIIDTLYTKYSEKVG